MPLKVVRNAVDGWDVIREGEEQALSNHVDQATAEEAAKLRAEEEGQLGEPDEEAVVVHEGEVHGLDDTRQGMKPAFLALAGLLAAVTILIVILALTGALTGFGS
jgi:hypothetical protein